MIKTFKSTDKTQLTEHFNVSEFRCKCGGTHDTKLDTTLVEKLEELFKALNCSKIIVNSGYRCSAHDKNVGGNGYGQHVNGTAADIVCYDQNSNRISSKLVSCAAQDVGFGGIANIDRTYTATHVDVRTSNFWKGDEVVRTDRSVTTDFYKYYNIPKTINTSFDNTNLNMELQTILNNKGAELDVDGIIGAKTLAEVKKYTIESGDKGELTRWIQKKLNSLGFDCGTPDGIAGNKTMSAIASFQRDNGLGIGYLGGSDFDHLLT
ncbi:MAG: D-Ala-D-Ala carboxypeptidase family metallohydrolase [Eubacterium sp.]|nr:D-Ala-D-Ala carboxypeptidase family metallohydrolase [Eubacterium sp.]